jgi:hypothetical protein
MPCNNMNKVVMYTEVAVKEAQNLRDSLEILHSLVGLGHTAWQAKAAQCAFSLTVLEDYLRHARDYENDVVQDETW